MTPANLLAATRAAGLTLALEDGAVRGHKAMPP